MKKSASSRPDKRQSINPSIPSIPVATTSPTVRTGATVLTKAVFIPFLLTLLTPLIYSANTYFGYISERSWYINGLIEAMFLVAIFTPDFFSAKLSRLQFAILLFLTVLLVADCFGVDPVQSFFSSYPRMEGFLLYLHLGLYFFALVRVPFPRQYWNTALFFSVLIAVVVVVKGYFSVMGWQAIDHRLIATVGNPSFLAGYLLLNCFLVAYLVTQFPAVSRLVKTILALIALLILVGGVYLSGTRSAIIGLAAGSIYLTGFWLWHRYRFSLKSVGWFAVSLVILLGVFWIARTTPSLQKIPIMYRLTHYSGDNNTLSPRFICWKIALNGIAEKPLLGWGQETFSYGFAEQYDPTILLSSDYSWYDRAHNVLIDLGFSAGVLGLLAYGFLWFCLVHRLRSNKAWLSDQARGTLGGIFVAYFFFNLFNFDSLLPLQLIFLLLAFIDLSPTSSTQKKPVVVWMLISRYATVLLLAVLSVYSVFQPYRTLRALDRQDTITDMQARINVLEDIYRHATGRQLDMADNLVSIALSILPGNQPEAIKQLCYQRATAVMEEQLAKHPNFTRLMTRLVPLYLAGREYDKAIALCQRINTIEGSKRPPAFILLGNAYLNKGNWQQAMASFEQAYQLYPRWEEPLLYKAFTFATRRDTAQCYTILRNIGTQTLSERLSFVKQIYGQAGNPHAFVDRLMQTEHKEFYPPAVYVEWAFTAFDLNDFTQMSNAINSYFNMYLYQHFTYDEIKQLIEDGKRGIRPERLSEMTNRLTQ